MEEDRQRKIEAGRQKLESFKSRRNKREQNDNSQSDSSLSLSLSPILLPDNADETGRMQKIADNSEESSISEVIDISNSENDRSLQELVIKNIPTDSPDLSLNSVVLNPDANKKSLNCSQQSDGSTISLNGLERFQNVAEEANILSEIIRQDEPFTKKTDSSKSNRDDLSQGTLKNDLSLGLLSIETSERKDSKSKSDDFSLNTKENIVPLLITDVDSLKEMSSNPSTISLTTTTTEYRQFEEGFNIGTIEFQNLLSNRDDQVRKLAEALQEVLDDRKHLEKQSKDFAEEISSLQQQLIETTAIIKKHNFNAQNEGKVPESNESIKNKTGIHAHMKSVICQTDHLEYEQSDLEETLSAEELDIISEIRPKIYMFISHKIDEYKNEHEREVKVLKDELETEKNTHKSEVMRLRELLTTIKCGSCDLQNLQQELNEKHSKEMEELRTYFERRCADIEKHYSEEVFSQQSRKMSESSISEMESEVFSGQPGPGGDASVLDCDRQDSNGLRLELQNKYHAELEILREDYENRLDELKINHENMLHNMEQKYLKQIESLKSDLEDAQKSVSAADFEMEEVMGSYDRRLQEQVMLAKMDIIVALQKQIQTLVLNASEDNEWPSELLQLRDIFIKQTKEQHSEEISKLKEQHERALTRAVEREKRNSVKIEESEIQKERDTLKKICSNFRHLVSELMKHFTRCEDELNNTLVEELLKYGFDKEPMTDESQLDSDKLDQSASSSISHKIKRVHFMPDVSGIITLIDGTSAGSSDISSEFQTELDLCLERLKAEANAILSLTSNMKAVRSSDTSALECDEDGTLMLIKQQLVSEKQLKNELSDQLRECRTYIGSLEGQLNHAKEKISELIENSRKETVSEGYGENPIMGSSTLNERIISLSELQSHARALLAEEACRDDSEALRLLENLCQEADKITDEAKKDHDDLVSQIKAADKKLQATKRFLEEQAVERESERDDAQRELAVLREQLKEAERNKEVCDRINNEHQQEQQQQQQQQQLKGKRCDCSLTNETVLKTVERLESQMRDMSGLMTECENRKAEAENELKEAVDKIWTLRDIIRDLEAQVNERERIELELRNLIEKLRAREEEQGRCNEELVQELEAIRSASRFEELEAELQRLRLSAELAGPDGAATQVRYQLQDIEHVLEKGTSELESLLAAVTSCSSPSEDMSIREQAGRTRLPGAGGDAELPLEQLARLREKLLRHSRAEDAALKRIKDLEMEVKDACEERDVMHAQNSEQMVLISSLQMRLEEQRFRADAVQKQTNSSLEHKIYELESINRGLLEKAALQEKALRQLEEVGHETKLRLEEQQRQLNVAGDEEQQELLRLREENVSLMERLRQLQDGMTSSAQATLPELFDSILNEKNAELDRMREKLQRVEENNSPEKVRRCERSPTSSVHSTERLVLKDESAETTFAGSSTKASDKDSPFVVIDVSAIEKQRDETVKAYEEKLSSLTSYVADVENLRRKLEFSEDTLRDMTDAHREEMEALRKAEKELRVELAECKVELQQVKREARLHEQVALELTKDKRQLQSEIEELQRKLDTFGDYERTLIEKNKEIYELEQQLAEVSLGLTENLQRSLREKDAELDSVRAEVVRIEKDLELKRDRAEALTKLLDEKQDDLAARDTEIEHLRQLVSEKDKIIDQMAFDSNSLHLSLEAIQSKIQESGNIYDLKRQLRDEQNLSAALHEELKHTKYLLDKEKHNSNALQLQDANIIESMRIRLEQVLDMQTETDRVLAEERAVREKLEAQCNVGVELTKAESELRLLRTELDQVRNKRRRGKKELELVAAELDRVRRELDEAQRREQDLLRSPVPESFLLKMREIAGLLKENSDDNHVMTQAIADLTEQRRALQSRIQELEQNPHHTVPTVAYHYHSTDAVFGKLLRLESYRKALVYQKQFLLRLLALYQNSQLLFLWPSSCHRSNTGASRFRAAAYVVVAIKRMQFIVRRWSTGARAQTQVPAPVPTCGDSPPTKERSGKRLGTLIRQAADLAPLETPALLERYVQRFDNIRQKIVLPTSD